MKFDFNIIKWYPFENDKKILQIGKNDNISKELEKIGKITVTEDISTLEEKFDYIIIYGYQNNLMEQIEKLTKEDTKLLLIGENELGINNWSRYTSNKETGVQRLENHHKKLTNIKLPENLTYLGGGAFKNCKSLKSITIPKGVTEINGETFVNCESLDSVVLHDDITSIHGETFINCISLREINLPSKITEIRGNTFQYCSSLRKIDIPTGVVRIGGHAFEGCSDLEEVNLPSTLKEIGSSAFRECSSLYEITIPKNTTSIAENAFKDSPTNKKYDGVGRNISDVCNSNYTKKQNTIVENNTTNNTSQDIINQTQDINKRMNNSLNNLYKNQQ